MALRQIRIQGDAILEKKCREITEMTPRIKELIEDMLDTMYDAGGVGLAAPQVGILKRIVVIDVSPEANQPIVLINPEVLETSGEQTGFEGCLSVPGKSGQVTRPNYAKVKAYNEKMEEIFVEGEELLLPEGSFYDAAEHPQGEHIEEEVHEGGVHEHIAHELV